MFDFTRQERGALVFLFLAVSLGIAVDFFSKRSAVVKSWVCAQEALKKPGLNTAGKEELMALPGIGEKLALRIIDYRRQNGGFSDIEELKGIKGITADRYRRLKDSFSLQ